MIPPAIAPKVAKLIPLLASEQDGEALAAVRAIGRTLVAAGSDFHALANALTATAPNVVSFDWSGFEDFAAKWTDPATAERPDPNAPDQPSTRHGLPIWGVKKLEPWCVVAQHCLQLDWIIPKASGGKFLTKAERDRLKKHAGWSGARPTNADADWMESVVERCHAAREVWRSDKMRTAA